MQETKVSLGIANIAATHLSTNILIKANGLVIGAIQRITIDEPAPGSTGVSSKVIVTCSRVRLDRIRIVEAFAGQTHLTPPHKPFDMEVIETIGNEIKTTTLKNCTILSTQVTYDVGGWMITEYITAEAD